MARHYAPARWYDSSQECAEDLADLVRPGDCLLVKGSSSVRMNRIVAKLRDIDRH
jgi:UDP-N-acetylmuramyl pentapeptide synthase